MGHGLGTPKSVRAYAVVPLYALLAASSKEEKGSMAEEVLSVREKTAMVSCFSLNSSQKFIRKCEVKWRSSGNWFISSACERYYGVTLLPHHDTMA